MIFCGSYTLGVAGSSLHIISPPRSWLREAGQHHRSAGDLLSESSVQNTSVPLRPQRHSWPARRVGLPRSSTASSATRARSSASKARQSRPLIAAPAGRAHTLQPTRGRLRHDAGGDGDRRTRGLENRMRGVVAPGSATLRATLATSEPVGPAAGHRAGKG